MASMIKYAGNYGTNGWTNPGNAVGMGESTCSESPEGVGGNWNSFGFSIPSSATINGIQVELKQSQSVATSITWYVYLRKGNALPSTNNRSFNETSTSACGALQPIRTYGGSVDLWGFTWTPSEINLSAFTVGITTESTVATHYLNWIRVTVYYTEAGACEPVLCTFEII